MRKSYDSYKERTLVNKSKGGDARAFEELVSRNNEKITSSILQLCRQNFHDAEDIKQTTLLKCWKYMKKFKGDSSFSTWAIRIAKNSFFDLYRKRKNKPEYSWEALTQTEKDDGFQSRPQIVELIGATSGDVVTKGLEESEFKKKLERVINSLPRNHKNVLKLILEDNDITYEEISRKLEIPLGTVMSRVHYARKNVKSKAS